MHGGHVALQTRHDVKQNLSVPFEEEKILPDHNDVETPRETPLQETTQPPTPIASRATEWYVKQSQWLIDAEEKQERFCLHFCRAKRRMMMQRGRRSEMFAMQNEVKMTEVQPDTKHAASHDGDPTVEEKFGEMTTNSSSSNASLLLPASSSLVSCYVSRPVSFILPAYWIIDFLFFLPFCLFIFHAGFQQWRQTRRALSHSDCFTYHLTAVETINIINCTFYCSAIYGETVSLIFIGDFLTSLVWHGQTLFQLLTCAEHYLAVVHPTFYLSLRNQRGVRLRNVAVLCVWLLSFVCTALMAFRKFLAFFDVCLLVANLAFVSFCSFSVMSSLYQPSPGGKEARRVDRAKQGAFRTILIILLVQVLRFIGSVIWSIVDGLNLSSNCLLVAVGVLVNLPSSFVLPLLFLQREGKLVCCKKIQQHCGKNVS
ncbi:uncharacterized protein LOC129379912 [Poeciliopsis prolifica]|uniref:uncharacterized protein LOC129379912 n=1 Tax=Poeciliopsis prolifica TaxID=188132 RepID=UPI0024140A37|nr:uncharacterized protein LOC129379912 [Poeciliopsis prolifica]